MRKATSNDSTTHVAKAQTTSSGTCPEWCTHRDRHSADDGAPICFGRSDRIVLSDPAQAETAPLVYGAQVIGSESPRITIERGDRPAFDLSVTEAERLVQAILAAVEEVSG